MGIVDGEFGDEGQDKHLDGLDAGKVVLILIGGDGEQDIEHLRGISRLQTVNGLLATVAGQRAEVRGERDRVEGHAASVGNRAERCCSRTRYGTSARSPSGAGAASGQAGGNR